MYQVFCRSPRKGMRWQEYSRPFQTKEAAEAVKKTAEERRIVDLYDNLLIYKVKEVEVKSDV